MLARKDWLIPLIKVQDVGLSFPVMHPFLLARDDYGATALHFDMD